SPRPPPPPPPPPSPLLSLPLHPPPIHLPVAGQRQPLHIAHLPRHHVLRQPPFQLLPQPPPVPNLGRAAHHNSVQPRLSPLVSPHDHPRLSYAPLAQQRLFDLTKLDPIPPLFYLM